MTTQAAGVRLGGGAADRSSRLWDRAPQMAHFRIETISGGGLGGTDQKRHHAPDHIAGLSVLVEVQPFERFDHPTDRHLFA